MSGDALPIAASFLHNIGVLATPPGGSEPLRGPQLRELVEVEGAAIAAGADGRIIAWGSERRVREQVQIADDAELIDAGGALAIPGLVDCHAHPVFAGDRAAEFDLRNTGASYEEIHAAGGGIRSTVDRTRAALAVGKIASRVREHYDWMLAAGTTTCESKSGYALTIDGELESLRVARNVAAAHAITTTGTLLAAHTVPEEYDRAADEYITEVCLPALVRASDEGIATAADVFLERGSFASHQAERYLLAARDLGLAMRLHGDQFSDSGAVDLAIRLGARSIDHLEELGAADDRLGRLACSDVAAVLLPLSSLMLQRPYAPGRALVDAGAIVALASDFNPGSSYGESLTLAMSLGACGCGLTAAETLTAVTANAAWVLGVSADVGRIETGKRCDVVLLDQPDVAHIAYHVGSPSIRVVVAGGHVVSAGQ